MFPQSDMSYVEERFLAAGRQVIPLVEAVNLDPGDIPGLAHAPLMYAPLNAMQHDSRLPDHSPGRSAVTSMSVVMSSPLGAAATTASPSPALHERLTP